MSSLATSPSTAPAVSKVEFRRRASISRALCQVFATLFPTGARPHGR
jgi:hypothetical protein